MQTFCFIYLLEDKKKLQEEYMKQTKQKYAEMEQLKKRNKKKRKI